MLALGLLLLLMVGAALAPDSILGRWLIRKPAEALARTTPRKALFTIFATAILLMLLASGPEFAVLFGLADLSMIAEVTALLFLGGVVARFETARRVTVRIARRAGLVLRRASRPRRVRVTRPRRPDRDDPAPGPGWAFA